MSDLHVTMHRTWKNKLHLRFFKREKKYWLISLLDKTQILYNIKCVHYWIGTDLGGKQKEKKGGLVLYA